MLIETKNFLQIMSNNWAFINFYFFTSENFPGIQSKVFKVKTFLIYLQLWIWNFAHFFSYIKIKKKRCFFIHPSLLLATRLHQPRHLLLLDATQKRRYDTRRTAAGDTHDDDDEHKTKKEEELAVMQHTYMRQQHLAEHDLVWQN